MDKEKINVGFSLLGIRTEQFALFEENFDIKKDSSIDVGFEFKLDQTSRQLGVFSSFTYLQSKKQIIKLALSCHFKIVDESWDQFLKVKETKLHVPKGFLTHLTVLTIGTARGVLYAKTEGTIFSKFILPTLDITKMITEDIEFEVNQTVS